MQQIIFFFIRNKNFLLFALLFFISLVLTVRTHSFHESKFLSSANFVSGSVYSIKSSITGYFDLALENDKLAEENMRLREQLEGYKSNTLIDGIENSSIGGKYNYFGAKVINNSYSKTKNLITIDKGTNDGIQNELGVITTYGIVGIVNRTSRNYATVQSLLNANSQISAKLKKSNAFGFLVWKGGNPNRVQLTDVPRLAHILVGDTIVTDGKSTIFPRGILVGTIVDYDLSEEDDYYTLEIELFNDMTNLNHVYVIENRHSQEILQLENEDLDAEQ
ncbi:MAG: rod shape-determining protein MreC [Candidatus Latescibacterota bacterium]|jgi:rod shape-determining protein MreC